MGRHMRRLGHILEHAQDNLGAAFGGHHYVSPLSEDQTSFLAGPGWDGGSPASPGWQDQQEADFWGTVGAALADVAKQRRTGDARGRHMSAAPLLRSAALPWGLHGLSNS